MNTYTCIIQLEGHTEFQRHIAGRSAHEVYDKLWVKWFESIPHADRIIKEHKGDISVHVFCYDR